MSPHTHPASPNAFCAAPAQPSAPAPRTAADLLACVVAARDLDQQPLPPPTWLWQGYLGPGKVTLLTSQWKSGKTTLVALLLARLQQGGQLAGLPVAQARAFVISEESAADWRPRFQHLGISDHVDLLCRPFTVQPNREQWLALVETAALMHDRRGSALVVIDSLAPFLPPHSENSAGALFECLTPLQRLTTAGMSVLLVHHPRKGKTVAGQSARGSGALPSFVDVIIEMGYYSQPDDLDRRRRLLAFSRHDETPRHLLLELQADGRDYLVLASGAEAALGESWPALVGVLATADCKMTRQEILDQWSGDAPRPEATTLWRWLSRAVAQGQVRQEGTGRPHDPFRYWLADREAMLFPEGGSREELQAWNDRMVAELFGKPECQVEVLPAAESPRSGGENATAALPVAATEEPAPPPEPVPPPERGLQSAATAAPLPDPVPVQPVEPLAPVPAAPPERLPFPFNIMNPADVPEAVWEQARAAQRDG
jgi:hypothetical protein